MVLGRACCLCAQTEAARRAPRRRPRCIACGCETRSPAREYSGTDDYCPGPGSDSCGDLTEDPFDDARNRSLSSSELSTKKPLTPLGAVIGVYNSSVASSPRILVVADSGDGDVIRSRLGEREITDVQVSPGNDDTLEAYLASPPDIVVLRATLSAGDALSFVGALRDGVDIVPGIVLVGDKDGPVQTALDAMEFKADRFLRWPPDASALAFAVNSCLELNKDFEKPPSTVGGVARVAELSMGVGNADVADVDTARDDEEGDDIDPRDLSQAGVAMFAESSRSENLLNGFFDDAVQDLIRAQVDSMLEAAVSDLRDNDAVAPPDRPRREPTQILSGPVPTTPPDAILDEEDASAEMDSGELPTRGGGTIVRELRQKMSDIEQRLFGEVGLGSEDTAPAPDIDLDSVVEETDSEHQRTELFVSGEVDTEAGTVSADEAATVIRPPTERGQRGDLAEDPPAELLARLWRQRYVGRASFRQNEAHRVLVFEAGRPVFATSNVVQDRMGDLLYREGKITRTQYAESRHMVAKTGRRMGEILVEMGFLKRRELLPAVRRHLEDVVYSLFAWETGEWATHPGEATGSEKIRLATPPAALIFEGIRRKLPLDRLQRRLGPASTVVVPLPDSEGRTAVDVPRARGAFLRRGTAGAGALRRTGKPGGRRRPQRGVFDRGVPARLRAGGAGLGAHRGRTTRHVRHRTQAGLFAAPGRCRRHAHRPRADHGQVRPRPSRRLLHRARRQTRRHGVRDSPRLRVGAS